MASVNKYFYSVGSEEEDADDTDPEGPKENRSDDLNTRLDLHNSVDAVVEANNSATGEAGISGCKRKRNDNEVSTLLVVVVAVQFSHWILIMYFISLYLY